MHFGGAISRLFFGSALTAHAWLHASLYVARAGTPRLRHRAPRPSGSPRLLLLCRTFPPALDGGVYRLLALVTAARGRGWDVDIVTRQPPDLHSDAGLEMAGRIPEGVRIRYWERPVHQPIARISPTIDGGFTEIAGILKTARAFPRPSVIVASGPMFSEFVAARQLSLETSVPYVLGYRDEWTTNLLSFVARGLTDRFWERFALSEAAAVICTTASMAHELGESFGPTVTQKVHVIPNGWDPLTSELMPPLTPVASEKLAQCIGFYGTLTDDIDLGIEGFIHDIESLIGLRPGLSERLRLRFVGRKSESMVQRLGSGLMEQVARTIDHLPVSAARREMRHCRALLLLNGPKVARALPGKVYEYIAARRPILVYGAGGEVEAFLAGMPGTRVIRVGELEELERAIEAVLSGQLERELEQRDDSLERSTSRAARSSAYLDVLASVARLAGPRSEKDPVDALPPLQDET